MVHALRASARHPERVFLRERSPANGTILLECRLKEILRAKRRAQDDVHCFSVSLICEVVMVVDHYFFDYVETEKSKQPFDLYVSQLNSDDLTRLRN